MDGSGAFLSTRRRPTRGGTNIPDLEVCDLYHKAVVWISDGSSDGYGQFKRAEKSVQLDCRWNDKTTLRRDAKGNLVTVDAVVTFPSEVPVGSTVYKGSQADLAVLESARKSNALTPAANDVTLYEVVTFNGTSDIKNRARRIECGLKRLSDTIPASET